MLLVFLALLSTASAEAGPYDRYKDRLDLPSEFTSSVATSNLIGITRAGTSYVAVGDSGHILVSNDKGRSWMQSQVPLSSPLVAVAFPTPQSGWAVGHDGVVLHSNDGGKHWERQLDGRSIGKLMVTHYEKLGATNDPNIVRALDQARRFQEDGPDKPFMDVYFENERSGWVIGVFNMILKTDDGGETWQPWMDRIENDNEYSLHALAGADGELFVVGELGFLQKLDRQKNRFVPLASPYAGTLFGVTGKPGVTLIYGLRGNLFRSRDKGKSWQSLKQNMEAALVGGTFLEDGRLVLVSNEGHVLVSEDDGDSFKQVSSKFALLSGVAPLDDKAVLVVGVNGVRYQPLN